MASILMAVLRVLIQVLVICICSLHKYPLIKILIICILFLYINCTLIKSLPKNRIEQHNSQLP